MRMFESVGLPVVKYCMHVPTPKPRVHKFNLDSNVDCTNPGFSTT